MPIPSAPLPCYSKFSQLLPSYIDTNTIADQYSYGEWPWVKVNGKFSPGLFTMLASTEGLKPPLVFTSSMDANMPTGWLSHSKEPMTVVGLAAIPLTD